MSMAEPVYNLDAEEAILGAMLFDPTVTDTALVSLSERDFYRELNQDIFTAIKQVNSSGESVNVITVGQKMAARLETAGGKRLLIYLVENIPSTTGHKSYIETLVKLRRKREIIEGIETLEEIASAGAEPDDIIDRGLQTFLGLRRDKTDELALLSEYALQYSQEFSDWLEQGFPAQGILTGFTDLDRILGGLKPGRLTIIAARPSMGKSQLILQMAQKCAERGDSPALFSLEMSKQDLLHRLIFAKARVNEYAMRADATPETKAANTEKVQNAYYDLMGLPIWVDDTASIKTQTAQARLMATLARGDIKIMFFDHVSLAGNTVKSGNNVERIGDIMRGLKAIAKICNVPVVLASQLSREVSKVRSDHRPYLEDLRGSGDLEQDADVVIGLYRHEYYNPKGTRGYVQECDNFLELLVLKQRMGKANPRGGLSTGIYYETSTGFMGNWQGTFPSHSD